MQVPCACQCSDMLFPLHAALFPLCATNISPSRLLGRTQTNSMNSTSTQHNEIYVIMVRGSSLLQPSANVRADIRTVTDRNWVYIRS